MSNEVFTSYKKEKLLSDRVASQIQALIVGNQFKPGDRLPSERELANQLGVSRTVIREAVRQLKARGLVEIRHGSGIVVTSVSVQQVHDSIKLFLQVEDGRIEYSHMAEVRRIVEIEAAGLAAERAEEADVLRMEQELQSMESMRERIGASGEARTEFARADVSFHLAIAGATKNPLLPALFSPLIDILIEQRLSSMDRPGALDQGVLSHREILGAIRTRDKNGAMDAMRTHLERSAAIMETVDGAQRRQRMVTK